MLDDAFKLTIDVLFNREESEKRESSFPVEGYNSENMWEHLTTLTPSNRLGLQVKR